MSEVAKKFLSRDKKLKKVIDLQGSIIIPTKRDYFRVLVMSIMNQQISGSAADAIYGRLKEACGGKIDPSNIMKLSISEMRKCGLSKQKISYTRDLAKKFASGEINPKKFRTMGDEEVLNELVQIRGIGRWTAEMFLIFSLGREDVFPADDIGIKRSIQKIYGLRDVSQKNLDKFSLKWKPYRSYASLYLWKSGDTKPPKNW